jgi:hypothetical protein
MLKKHKDRKEKNKELQKKFQAIKEKPVEEANTRIVNVKYRTGCGCGGSYDWFHGEVPVDSNINDGDYINSFSDINNPKAGRYSG